MVGGHGRLKALMDRRESGAPPPEGIDEDWSAPVLRGWSSKNDEEALAYLIASNRTTELGGWDNTELLASLDRLDDLEGVGYTLDEIQEIANKIAELPPTPITDPDAVPAPPKTPITKLGDVWELGTHRILCGDSRDYGDVEKLMAGQKVNVAFTSPPYASQRKYDESSGFKPIPPGDYVEWFDDVQANVRTHLADDGSWFVNIKPASDGLDAETYVLELVLAHAQQWGWHFATELCWERSGMPQRAIRRFKNQFEPVYQFSLGEWKFRPDAVRHESKNVPVALGPGSGPSSWVSENSNFTQQGEEGGEWFNGRVESGMAYPGNRLATFASSHSATGHSAAFPVGLPSFFIKAYSDTGDNIYDPFMGSGSTLIAAHNENRNAYGIEISPAYCDVICRRFQEHTGINPIIQSTGEPVDFTQPKEANDG